MALFVFFWTLAALPLLKVTATASSSPPVPVLKFQEKILDGEDTDMTCMLPCTALNCLDVDLSISPKTLFKNCTSYKGNNPNITCTIEVTQEVHDMEFTCDATFKTRSLSKKMTISKASPNGSRREPVLATILVMLVATSLLYSLC